MTLELLIGQLFLALFNIANSHIDAYRILENKKIAHAINFGAYLVFTAVLCLVLGVNLITGPAGLFFLSAFFNRQFTFDIPLNVRRGLAWYYQSQDNPPKAVLDKIERAIFGTGEEVGKTIFKFYFFCYAIVVNVWIWAV